MQEYCGIMAQTPPRGPAEKRKDRRLAAGQSGKRKAVLIFRERDRNSLPAVFRTEWQALDFVRSRIAEGTVINADELAAWNDLHAHFEMKRINHQEAYSLDGACTNWAEEFFSRMRARGNRPSPPSSGRLPAPICSRGQLARRSPSRP
jgi:hypothetical protein